MAKSNGLKLERIPQFALLETPPQEPETDKEKLKEDATPKDAKAKDATAREATAKEATAEVVTPKDAATKDVVAKDVVAKDATAKDVTAKDKKAKDAKLKKKAPKDEKPAEEKPLEVKTAEALKPKDETPDLEAIKNAVSFLNSGDVSDFVPLEKSGGLIAVLEKRMPADKSGYAVAKTKFESQILLQSQTRAFMEWLRDRRRAAGVSPGAG